MGLMMHEAVVVDRTHLAAVGVNKTITGLDGSRLGREAAAEKIERVQSINGKFRV